MKRNLKLFICISLVLSTSCEVLDSAARQAGNYINDGSSTPESPALTNNEVVAGLKEALTVGINNSVDVTSVTDGFLGNPQIKLPFPPDALKVRQKALDLGLNGQVERFETTLNRAAEEACKEALNRVIKLHNGNPDFQIGYIAMRKDGEVGAACLKWSFDYALFKNNKNKLCKTEGMLN